MEKNCSIPFCLTPKVGVVRTATMSGLGGPSRIVQRTSPVDLEDAVEKGRVLEDQRQRRAGAESEASLTYLLQHDVSLVLAQHLDVILAQQPSDPLRVLASKMREEHVRRQYESQQ